MYFENVLLLYLLLASFKIREIFAKLDWWQTAAIYQIYPKSFKDSNGDGVGDLKGIEQQVSYFTDTGIDVIWLSSIFKSPMIDDGYDISDYKEIDPVFGSLADFDSLVATLKSKNVKLLLDFVPNHTSDECEWFKKSIQKVLPYTDYYVWRDPKEWRDNGTTPVPPNNWISILEGSAWKFNAERKQYYLHQFTDKQPDLNYRCPDLLNEMKNIMRFWLDKGVDGFRIGAVQQIIEAENFPDEPVLDKNEINGFLAYDSLNHVFTEHLPETLEILAQFRDVVDEYKKKDGYTRVIATEVWGEIPVIVKYYGSDIRPASHFPFNFRLTFLRNDSSAKDFVSTINAWMDGMPSGRTANWVLGNHDKPRVASKFNKESVDALNVMLLLLPGVAISYNGEELGMEDTKVTWEQTNDSGARNVGPHIYETKTRDSARTPFQWSADFNAGFLDKSAKTWLPINSNYEELNFEKQKKEEKSHWKVYRDLLKLRKNTAFEEGELKTCVLTDRAFAFTRFIKNKETYVVIINLKNEQTVLDLKSKMENLPSLLQVELTSINSEYIPGSKISEEELGKFKMNSYSAVVLHGLLVQEENNSELVKFMDLKEPSFPFILVLTLSVAGFYILYVILLIRGKKTWLRRIKLGVRTAVKSTVNDKIICYQIRKPKYNEKLKSLVPITNACKIRINP